MSIHLSEKHGVNPAVPLCFFCLKPKNELILTGRLPDDQEAPQHHVWDREPCDECAGHMKDGVILISVRDGETGGNPYRTGGWVVIADAGINQLVSDETVREQLLRVRVGFIEDAAWDRAGLPRG